MHYSFHAKDMKKMDISTTSKHAGPKTIYISF